MEIIPANFLFQLAEPGNEQILSIGCEPKIQGNVRINLNDTLKYLECVVRCCDVRHAIDIDPLLCCVRPNEQLKTLNQSVVCGSIRDRIDEVGAQPTGLNAPEH